MPTPMEKAAAYLLKLEADRAAALAASEEKAREAMLIKAREDGFKEAMEIFGLTIVCDNTEEELGKTHRAKRRDIRQLIIKELSFSGKTMTKQEIAKAIDYVPEGTEAPEASGNRRGSTKSRGPLGTGYSLCSSVELVIPLVYDKLTAPASGPGAQRFRHDHGRAGFR
jgi:hypothetical protein